MRTASLLHALTSGFASCGDGDIDRSGQPVCRELRTDSKRNREPTRAQPQTAPHSRPPQKSLPPAPHRGSRFQEASVVRPRPPVRGEQSGLRSRPLCPSHCISVSLPCVQTQLNNRKRQNTGDGMKIRRQDESGRAVACAADPGEGRPGGRLRAQGFPALRGLRLPGGLFNNAQVFHPTFNSAGNCLYGLYTKPVLLKG